jgi:hypothetical protein
MRKSASHYLEVVRFTVALTGSIVSLEESTRGSRF